MQKNSQAFQVNEPSVISEIIDGEVIILNFESGTYYSLNTTGMVIWQHIRERVSGDSILAYMQHQYEADNDAIAADLSVLLEQLQVEKLIVATQSINTSWILDAETTDLNYEKPMLEKYTDLQDLLLLDPIHDVDEQGWPNKK